MIATRCQASVNNDSSNIMVWASDSARLKVDHEIYYIYTNGELAGIYNAYGYDRATGSIERHLMQLGLVAVMQTVGNRIEIFCDNDSSTVARTLKLILRDG